MARVRGTSTIAGSTATMDRLLRTLAGIRADCGADADAALAAAVRMTSTTPARALGLEKVGELRAGYAADLAVLDRDLRVAAVMVHGDWLNGP